jgi:hypothetical protein
LLRPRAGRLLQKPRFHAENHDLTEPHAGGIGSALASDIAAELSILERVLLFCLASGTEWAQAGVTGATTTMMLVRGLVGRDRAGGLKMTPQGREVFKVLIGG